MSGSVAQLLQQRPSMTPDQVKALLTSTANPIPSPVDARTQGAGILDMRGIVPDDDPPHWLSYLEVDDVDRRIAEIERNGGRIVRQPFDVLGFGRIAIGADATGAIMAWVTSKR